MDKKYVVLTGDRAEGAAGVDLSSIDLYGPFASANAANKWAREVAALGSWQTLVVNDPTY
jgi:hypothetical protein